MSTAARQCVNGGVIGGTATYRPSDAWETGWGQQDAPVLCSNLVCRCCSTPVRSIANHAFKTPVDADPADPDVRPIDFAGRRIDLVKALRLDVDERARTFACACRAVSTRNAHPLSLPVNLSGAPLPWTCQGHPALGPTSELDGEPLPSNAAGWLVLGQQALAGQWPTRHRGRDVHDAAHPAFRIAHALLHIPDTTLQKGLGRRLGPWGLTNEDVETRRTTLDLYYLLPRFFGSEALGDALTKHRALFDDVFPEGDDAPNLGFLLRRVIDRNLSLGPFEALSAATRVDMIAGFGCPAFVLSIVRDTPTWAIEQLVKRVAHEPRLREALEEAMQTFHPGLVPALERELRAL